MTCDNQVCSWMTLHYLKITQKNYAMSLIWISKLCLLWQTKISLGRRVKTSIGRRVVFARLHLSNWQPSFFPRRNLAPSSLFNETQTCTVPIKISNTIFLITLLKKFTIILPTDISETTFLIEYRALHKTCSWIYPLTIKVHDIQIHAWVRSLLVNRN